MSAATPWSLLLHSGWPVFPLAALVESELREDTHVSLAVYRLGWKEPSENCNEEQEAVRLAASLYVGEGRTVKLTHIIDFFHQEVGDVDLVGEEFITAVARAKPRHPGVCTAALGVAYAALADALQCHWRRPTSTLTHQLIDIAVEKAQGGALRTFGEAADSFNALASSRWPLLPLLSRLQPRSAATSTGVLVSWSSREAELGGLNWAKNFAQEVFSFHDFVLEEDVDCADIFVYRSSLPTNFGGVLIFVDGEGSPADSLQEELLQSYPASIVVGPLPAGGDSVFFPVPYASTSFASRSFATPNSLLLPRPVDPEDRPGFAAYLVYKCYPHREGFFRLLDARGREAGLGPVETLSRCGDAGEIDRTSQRYAETYMDDAADLFRRFRFALVFENKIQTRYVTEKIVNAFVAGAVPIYWGSDFVAELFNPDAMIWVNSFESFEAAVEHVIRVASEPELYAAYASAPPIRNTSAGRWYFSWHRDAPSLDGESPTLREELAAAAMKMHVAGLDGSLPAVERRPFDYAETFPS
ncbi:unnamed protein product [Symbiodinium sp. CCMP2456]|nr:unnamed protein product [Symbiodinium sp. CCMP2456]